MDAPEKVARQRLSVLELAEQLGNAAEACRRRGMDRTSFYEWKRRFQLEGLAGLKDLPPIHKSHPQTTPVAVVPNDVLPFYERIGLKVGAILTDNGREFCGTDAHPFELYLALAGIEHRKTRVRTPGTNGFVERFNGTVLDEFFRVKMREIFYASVEALQDDLDAWLVHYNTERPHLGYRNMGRRPWDTVSKFVSQEA